jgi:hypothetical protein
MNGEELTFKVNIEAGDTAQIEIIEPKALANLVEANQEVKRLTDEINKLKAAEKEQGQLTAEQQQEMEKLNAELKQARTNYQNQQKDLNALTNAQKASGQSYNELVAQNKALSIAMRQLPLDDTTGKLQKLQQQYNQNNDRLKQFDATMGNHQRNVGNYPKILNGIGDAFQALPGPIGGASNAFASFGRMLLANPIGLVVTAIGLLINGLMKLNPIMEEVEKITSAVGAAFRWVTDAIYNFVTGQEQAQRSLGATIKAQYELTAAIDAFEDSQGKFNITQAQYNEEISKEIRLAKDKSKSDADRLAAADRADKLIQKQFKEQQARNNQNIKNLQKQLDLVSKNTAADADKLEIENKIAEAINKRAELQDKLSSVDKIRYRIEQEIAQEAEKQAQKAQEAAQKAQEAAQKRKEALQQELELIQRVNLEMDELSQTLLANFLDSEARRREAADKAEQKYRADKRKREETADATRLEFELSMIDRQLTAKQALEAQHQQRIFELRQYYESKNIQSHEAANMAKLKADKEYSAAMQALNKKDRDDKLANLLQIANDSVAVGRNLFGDTKAIAVAQAIIDTLAASVSVLATTRGGTIARFAAMASVLTAGYANVKKILATNIGSSSTTGAPIPTTTASAGRMPMVGNAFNPGAPITMGNANLSAGMAGAMGSRDMGITVNAKVDRKGLAIAVREGEREIKTQQFTFA